jgi:hypothetical protein
LSRSRAPTAAEPTVKEQARPEPTDVLRKILRAGDFDHSQGTYEVIIPPNKLKDLVGRVTQINDDLLAKAESAAQVIIDTVDPSKTTKPQIAALQQAVDAILQGAERTEHEKLFSLSCMTCAARAQ